MTTYPWQLVTPLDAVIFDCDGTLTHLEGINELAKTSGLLEKVKELTEKAMGESGLNASLYQQRLALVKPNRAQLNQLGEEYYRARTPEIKEVIALFRRQQKSIYILSAGLALAVTRFAELLQVPAEHVTAVNIIFDAHGNYLDYDKNSPLVGVTGKVEFVKQIKTRHQRILYIGDGLNDVPAQPFVERFVGFGGAFYYEKVAKCCQYYIHCNSMAPLLPLALTASEVKALATPDKILYELGLKAIQAGEVTILPTTE